MRRLLVPVLCALALGADASRVTRGVRDERARRRPSEMVRVPAGAFVMGVDEQELVDLFEACTEEVGPEWGPGWCSANNPIMVSAYTGERREVWLRAFEIDRYEVTTAQYRACVSAGTCDMRPLVSGDTRYAIDELPMVNVTWHDAVTYCDWRGKRLPTEAEWEKAARSTDGRRFPWGNFVRDDGANLGMVDITLGTFVPDDADGAKIMVAPGTFRWGRSAYGVHDLSGNVSEWVADWYSDRGYADLPTTDPGGLATGVHRAVRGGSYHEPRFHGRTYFRLGSDPNDRSVTRGFRCAKSVAQAGTTRAVERSSEHQPD
jgi:formylglycine-generating enzyme required for sulfatase activity